MSVPTQARNSLISRVLPVPASPRTPNAWGAPSRSFSAAPRSAPSSIWRPTKLARKWPAVVKLRARSPTTGCALPLNDCSPRSSNSNASSARRRVCGPTQISPLGAAPIRRAAKLMVSPSGPAVPLPNCCSPVTTMPVLTALCSAMATPVRASTPGLSRATASCSSSAARSARTGSSSCAAGTPNIAMIASPTNFSMRPSYFATISAAAPKTLARIWRVSSGSSRSESSVKPVRSENNTLTCLRSAPWTWRSAANALAQLLQTRELTGFSAPQVRHRRSDAVGILAD